jgi:hypothetical protein
MKNVLRWLLNQPPYHPDQDEQVVREWAEIQARSDTAYELLDRTNRLIDTGTGHVFRSLIDDRGRRYDRHRPVQP